LLPVVCKAAFIEIYGFLLEYCTVAKEKLQINLPEVVLMGHYTTYVSKIISFQYRNSGMHDGKHKVSYCLDLTTGLSAGPGPFYDHL